MTDKKIWFITGASRGMGVDFANAALAAGHAVVATGRDTSRVSKAVGQSNELLAVKLDVTSRADAEAAVRAAVDHFGRIDVLVNNAASFYAGYFEELTPEQFDRQFAASLIGPMNVTRAVRPRPRLTQDSSARSCLRSIRPSTHSHPSPTTTNAEQSKLRLGRLRMVGNLETRRSSHERSSPSSARTRRPAASLPAPMPLPPQSRSLPT